MEQSNFSWKPLGTIRQKDVFPREEDTWADIDFVDRPTGKAIVFDRHDNIALVGTEVNSFYLLPGGGIDQNESIEAGIIRECLEEIGCHVILERRVGTIGDFRNRDKKRCINYCYTARLAGDKGELTLTEEEKKNGLHVMWVPLDKAIALLEKEVGQIKRGKVAFYNTGFNIMRDHRFLLEIRQLPI